MRRPRVPGGEMRRPILLALLLALSPGLAVPSRASDVRVLIDVSGSMRQNDPDNLRRPALRLLVGLLQPGNEAGVWTFARQVNMLVPHGPVDTAWKKQASARSEQIASPGQFTNIEEVLERASRSWSGVEPTAQRHLILLTDGMVDVAKDPELNQASRDRILREVLPRIQAAGARIHAVALSDRADHALLRQLTAATDGWYQQVDAADQLQRVFLRIFDKVGQPEGVPLEGNAFQLDRAVKEATLLVFRGPAAAATRLHAPDGSTFEDSDLTAGVAWDRDQGYDLITIANPAAGEWRLEADADPDNRVMIVTDLQLQTSALPNLLATGERVPFVVHLANQGQVIDRRAFLDLVQMQAVSTAADGPRPQALNDAGEAGDEVAGDGRYGLDLVASGRGEVSLRVRAESNTFVREKRFVYSVTAPASLSVAAGEEAPMARLAVDATVLPEVARSEIWQQDPQGERLVLPAAATADGAWSAPLADPAWPVWALVEGRTRAGNLLGSTLGPEYAAGAVPRPLAAVEIPPEPALVASSVSGEPAPQSPAPPAAAAWLMPAALFGGFNLLLILGGGAIWWLLRRRRGTPDYLLLISDEVPGAGDRAAENAREEAA